MDKFTEAANKINKIKNKYHKLHPEVKQEYFKVYDEDITEEKKNIINNYLKEISFKHLMTYCFIKLERLYKYNVEFLKEIIDIYIKTYTEKEFIKNNNEISLINNSVREAVNKINEIKKKYYETFPEVQYNRVTEDNISSDKKDIISKYFINFSFIKLMLYCGFPNLEILYKFDVEFLKKIVDIYMKTLTENEFIKNNKAETSIKIENNDKKIKKLSHSRIDLYEDKEKKSQKNTEKKFEKIKNKQLLKKENTKEEKIMEENKKKSEKEKEEKSEKDQEKKSKEQNEEREKKEYKEEKNEDIKENTEKLENNKEKNKKANNIKKNEFTYYFYYFLGQFIFIFLYQENNLNYVIISFLVANIYIYYQKEYEYICWCFIPFCYITLLLMHNCFLIKYVIPFFITFLINIKIIPVYFIAINIFLIIDYNLHCLIFFLINILFSFTSAKNANLCLLNILSLLSTLFDNLEFKIIKVFISTIIIFIISIFFTKKYLILEYNLNFIIYFLVFNLLFYQLFFFDKKIINQLNKKSLLITNLNYSILSSCLFDHWSTKFISIFKNLNFRNIFKFIKYENDKKNKNIKNILVGQGIILHTTKEKDDIDQMEDETQIKRQKNMSLIIMILNKNIPRIQFQNIKVIGDGNCFFRAISVALGKDEEEYIEVKDKIIDFMNNNKQMIIEEIGEEYWNDFENFKSEKFEWAQEWLIGLVPRVLKINLVILKPSTENKENYDIYNNYNIICPSRQTIIIEHCNLNDPEENDFEKLNDFNVLIWTGINEFIKKMGNQDNKDYNKFENICENLLENSKFDSNEICKNYKKALDEFFNKSI